ncbi:beclin-1-like protein [Hevea brasiliensis]|uniref:beclin-1-like protein n=1 Tax=Hevea brasiliensis TaxID=3981 RepID=UPI0025E8F5AD|nr:beclin-1-like protein [Hevea brasiliensis]
MDNSFVVLPKQRPQVQGGPSRTRNGAAQPHTGQSGRAMEESFVVVYKSEPAPDGGGTHLPSLGGPNGQLQPNNTGFQSTITVLKRAFEIATTRQSYIEAPLCLECIRVLSDKLDKEVADGNRDIEAYEDCLQRLEGETQDVLSVVDFLKQELKEERDAILAKTEVSQAHLELLKQTNVLNDAFPIHHDGEFGTINNFRLGRLPKILVEWDEINAAWGQACLLLHTMCQYFKQKFHYPLSMSHLHFFPPLLKSLFFFT